MAAAIQSPIIARLLSSAGYAFLELESVLQGLGSIKLANAHGARSS